MDEPDEIRRSRAEVEPEWQAFDSPEVCHARRVWKFSKDKQVIAYAWLRRSGRNGVIVFRTRAGIDALGADGDRVVAGSLELAGAFAYPSVPWNSLTIRSRRIDRPLGEDEGDVDNEPHERARLHHEADWFQERGFTLSADGRLFIGRPEPLPPAWTLVARALALFMALVTLSSIGGRPAGRVLSFLLGRPVDPWFTGVFLCFPVITLFLRHLLLRICEESKDRQRRRSLMDRAIEGPDTLSLPWKFQLTAYGAVGVPVLLWSALALFPESPVAVQVSVSVAFLTLVTILLIRVNLDRFDPTLTQPFADLVATRSGVFWIWYYLGLVLLLSLQIPGWSLLLMMAVHVLSTALAAFGLTFLAGLLRFRRRTVSLGAFHTVPPAVIFGCNLLLARWFSFEGFASAGLAWVLTVGPAILLLPFLSLTHYRCGGTTPDLPETGDRPAEWVSHVWSQLRWRSFGVDAERARLVALSIFRRNLPGFVITLPWSFFLALAPVLRPSGIDLGFPLFAAWVTATVGWLAPFVAGLYNLEETFSFAHKNGLYRAIQRARHHVLILGFGDLGRRLVRDEFSKQIIAFDHVHDHFVQSEVVLLPNGQLGKVLLNPVVIDDDSRLAAGAAETPEGIKLAFCDLTDQMVRLKADREIASEPKFEFYGADDRRALELRIREKEGLGSEIAIGIIAVVGDATSHQLQNFARISSADFLVSLLRRAGEPDQPQTVLRRVEKLAKAGVVLPSVLAVHSSTVVPFVANSAIRHRLPVHTVYPEYLEASPLASVLRAFYARCLQEERPRFRVLICGRGKRIYYLLDAFLKTFTEEQLHRFRERAAIVICGIDGVLESQATDINFAERQLISAEEELKALLPKRLRILPLTSRNVPGSDNVHRDPLSAIFIKKDCRDIITAKELHSAFRPDAVVVSDHEAFDELRTLAAMITATNHSRDNPVDEGQPWKAPFIAVAEETGKKYLEDYLKGELHYYASEARLDLLGTYPQTEDGLVDVLEETVDRIIGLQRAYESRSVRAPRVERGVVAQPMEASFCTHQGVGQMAAVLSKLAGYESDASDNQAKSAETSVSLTNARFVIAPDDRFKVVSLVRAERRTDLEPIDEIARVAVTSDDRLADLDTRHLKYMGRQARLEFGRFGNSCDWVVSRILGGRRTERLQSAEGVRHCCGMPNCPVEALHKMEVLYSVGGSAAVADPTRCYGAFPAAKSPKNLMSPATESALALITASCRHATSPGGFAVAMSSLVLEPLRFAHTGGLCLNLTYASTQECHDERQAVFTCYGKLEERIHPEALRPFEVIEEIRIRPVALRPGPEWQQWLRYGSELRDFMNRQDHEGAQLSRTEPSIQFNEILVRRESEGWEVLTSQAN